MTPQRIQLKRSKGWRLQKASLDLNGLPAVKVDRTTIYGNPSRIGWNPPAAGLPGVNVTLDESLDTFENEYLPDVLKFDPHFLDELRGKNIACWCPFGQRCHGDILLRLANTPALFIPLFTKFYDAFKRGDKDTEYRQRGSRWNAQTCWIGRRVILARGYGKKNRLTGHVVGFHYDSVPSKIPGWVECYGSNAGDASCIKILLDSQNI